MTTFRGSATSDVPVDHLLECVLVRGADDLIDDLSGLARTHPGLAFCFATMLFSLAGIPPLAGFFAKWYVFAAAIKAGLVTLAVIGVVTSVVGAYYYVRIVKIMYFDEGASPLVRVRRPLEGALILLAALAVSPLGYLLIGPLGRLADRAAGSIF